MNIYKNSKKGGFAVSSNQPSGETLAGIGLSLLAVLAVGAFSLLKPKKNTKSARKQKGKKKTKHVLNLAVIIPAAYKLGKGIFTKNAIEKFKNQFTDGVNKAADDLGIDHDDTSPIEVEYAIPIGSEEEMYEYVKENEI